MAMVSPSRTAAWSRCGFVPKHMHVHADKACMLVRLLSDRLGCRLDTWYLFLESTALQNIQHSCLWCSAHVLSPHASCSMMLQVCAEARIQ